MKIKIHPAFKRYEKEILKISQEQFTPDIVFCNHRNTVVKTEMQGIPIIVKKYKRPTLINCLVYTFFRKNKALRSYLNAQKLLDMGIETPKPIAYITVSKFYIFHTGYYISEYLPYKTIKETYKNLSGGNVLDKANFEHDFISFLEKIYKLKISHKDFNSENILVNKIEDRFHFSLVDINRMTFDKDISVKIAMRWLVQLGLSIDDNIKVLNSVSPKWEISLEKCAFYLLLNKYQKKILHNIKHIAKNMLFSIKKVAVKGDI